jgi:hypothetical protein
MRRVVVLLTVAAVMAAMMAFSSGPAAAAIGEPQLQMEEDGMWDFGSGGTSVEWSYYNGYYGKTTYNSSGYPIKYERCKEMSGPCETVWETKR